MSQVAGREGESFASPREQRDRIEVACKRDGLTLLEVHDELDVSGGAALDERPGLSAAVEAVEDGRADVIVAAYFDRLIRSLEVQAQLLRRVEAAGGRVLAVDVGDVSHASAGQWLSATMLGAVSEYFKRATTERSREAVIRAVARGVTPYANTPPGLRKRADGTLEPDPATVETVREAFQLRADGATIKQVRAFLAEHGIARSYHGVQHMLGSRLYLGEIHFGKLVNLRAHEPIIDAALFRAVQRAKVGRGRRASSDRLLARLGVLRCGNCGSRMVVGSANHGNYQLYRCPPTGDCKARQTISAPLVEGVVWAAARDALADQEGRASIETDARQAEAEAERAQRALEAAVRAFEVLGDEPSAVERLAELRADRDEKRERAARLGGQRAALAISAGDPRISPSARRALIATVIERADIGPGRGAERISVHLFGE